MKDLTLAQMQSMCVDKWMSDKEVVKSIEQALRAQAQHICTTNKESVKSLDDVLKDGGLFTYKLGKKSYKLNVLTKIDMRIMDNIENNTEAGVEYDITKPYRYHIRNSHDHYVTVKAKSYEEAQQVIDSIYSKGLYKVSCSVL